MNETRSKLFRRAGLMWAVVLTLFLAGAAAFGWWAADRIDAQSVSNQTRSIHVALSELADRTVVEQEGSTIWDEAVVNVRGRNDAWMAENLAEWVSSYFGHDRVYILDPQDLPIRSVKDGARVPDGSYEDDRSALAPLVTALRETMRAASVGQVDSTASLEGAGELDQIMLPGGLPAIVSIRPILPSSDQVSQGPGQEYLHISVRLLDEDVASAISSKYSLQNLHYSTSIAAGAQASTPILSREGDLLGYFVWTPYKPATQLLQETAPAAGVIVLFASLLLASLVRRLQRTVAQLEQSESRAEHLAFHDPLSGLPNRALFEDRLEQALANRNRSGSTLALHMIDLDHFKQVNDSLGHPAGDELIRQVAGRLQSIATDVDTVARLGGDEFAFIQVGAGSSDSVLTLGRKFLQEMERPFDLQGHVTEIGVSVGIAIATEDDLHLNDLLRQADLALYQAKAGGRGQYQVFAQDLGEAVRHRRALEIDLRQAVKSGDGLSLVYQPIFDARSRRLIGAEALVRWDHPVHGRLSPDVFIPLAEERGLIGELGLWVLRQACTYASTSDVPWIAVNVSPLQFSDDRLPDRVSEVLKTAGLAPDRLELEITEGLLLQNSPIVQDSLRSLRKQGIRIALDDFGTGYSSISYLRNYGVDKLKIDRSYVMQIEEDLEVSQIVKCIIDLARAMKIAVTAEGVETERQGQVLQAMGCGQLQGYLLSRPVTGKRLEELIMSAQGQRRRAS